MQVFGAGPYETLAEEGSEVSFCPLKQSIVDIDLVKGLNVPGYSTDPEYPDIVRMTLDEVRSVRNFTIGNSHGKIVWEGYTDLTKIFQGPGYCYKDISEFIVIEP